MPCLQKGVVIFCPQGAEYQPPTTNVTSLCQRGGSATNGGGRGKYKIVKEGNFLVRVTRSKSDVKGGGYGSVDEVELGELKGRDGEGGTWDEWRCRVGWQRRYMGRVAL
ncbi:Uncharacterized protein Adt_17283 [Abeliophyllum distichum]|uniref:Uncharacterized protein n=1 Tax=Abeliophyllum distichum TaxID=126358 RepID=A0ABD1TGL0_9LAMI